MELKTVFVLVSLAVSFFAYIPYLLSIVAGFTKPHAYSWLIWTVTVGIGTAGVVHGGGGLAFVGLAIATVFCFVVFLLSLRYGTPDITKSDTVTLVAAIVAVIAWVFLENPLLSVMLAAGIDVIGYWPSIRKSYFAPWSESISVWLLWCVSIAFSLLALDEYNLLTTAYYAAIFAANLVLVTVCFYRRERVPKPASKSK